MVDMLRVNYFNTCFMQRNFQLPTVSLRAHSMSCVHLPLQSVAGQSLVWGLETRRRFGRGFIRNPLLLYGPKKLWKCKEGFWREDD